MFTIARTTSFVLLVMLSITLTPIDVDAFFGRNKSVYIDEYRSSWNPGHARYYITIQDDFSFFNSRASSIMEKAFAETPKGESMIATIMRADAAHRQGNKIKAETAKIHAETELIRAYTKQLKANNAATSERIAIKQRKPTVVKPKRRKPLEIARDKWHQRIKRLPISKASKSRLSKILLQVDTTRLMKKFERKVYAEIDKIGGPTIKSVDTSKPVNTSYLFEGL